MTRDGAATTVDPFLSEEICGKCMVYMCMYGTRSLPLVVNLIMNRSHHNEKSQCLVYR